MPFARARPRFCRRIGGRPISTGWRISSHGASHDNCGGATRSRRGTDRRFNYRLVTHISMKGKCSSQYRRTKLDVLLRNITELKFNSSQTVTSFKGQSKGSFSRTLEKGQSIL